MKPIKSPERQCAGKKKGKPMKNKYLTIRATQTLKAKLKEYCAAQKITISSFLTTHIETILSENQN